MEIISRFKERPKNKIAWKAMWLGLASLFVPPFLGMLSMILRLIFDPVSYNGGMAMGFGGVILALFLSISAIITSIKAWRMGERSWVMWLGMVPAFLIGLFWIILLIGELMFPH